MERERYQQAMDSRVGRAREKAEPIGREPYQQAMDARVERKGASYKITQTKPAQDPNAHSQVTQGSSSDMFAGWKHPKTGLEMTPDEEFEEESRWEANHDQDRMREDDY